jgi:hypothetical protein
VAFKGSTVNAYVGEKTVSRSLRMVVYALVSEKKSLRVPTKSELGRE